MSSGYNRINDANIYHYGVTIDYDIRLSHPYHIHFQEPKRLQFPTEGRCNGLIA